jgi:hypothetical protein
MPEAQLRLFPEPRPLLERFGADFFRTVPARPGVYLMTGEKDRVLYIGKARNLRQRLSSYKYPRSSRKLMRLACRVRSIVWEICDDGPAASMRENELLRLHKPTFNVLNTRAEHYPFVGLRVVEDGLILRLTKSSRLFPGEQLFGAFKGLPLARSAFGALVRLLWRVEHPDLSLLQMPLTLINSRTPEMWRMRGRALEPGGFPEFLSGRSDVLLAQLEASLAARGSHFEEVFHLRDMELLREFFARGPRRNAQLRDVFRLPGECISQSELDDLLVLREQYANPIAPDHTVS